MWMNRAKYCPACATPLEEQPVAGRLRPKCPKCSLVLFKNPASASGAVILNDSGEVLLIRRAIEPFRGQWALPAGYQEIDESPEETARREVIEETGLEIEVLGLLGLTFLPDDERKPANLSVHLCRRVGGELCAADDASEAAWFSLGELPEDIGFHNRELILEPLRVALQAVDGDPARLASHSLGLPERASAKADEHGRGTQDRRRNAPRA